MVPLAYAQWSQPALVVRSGQVYQPFDFHLLCSAGDTLWVFETRQEPSDTWTLRSHWGMGDSWPDSAQVTRSYRIWNSGAGIDPQGRIWLAWYNGELLAGLPPMDSWGIVTCIRDAAGWHAPELAIPAPYGHMAFPLGQNFASDAQGQWYMGIQEEHAPMPNLYESAMFSRLSGDTWTCPKYIAQGMGDPTGMDHYLPVLVARPDSGLWAVHAYGDWTGQSAVIVDRLVRDSVIRLMDFAGTQCGATRDSAGRLWIVYVQDSAYRSVVLDGDSVVDQQVISADVASSYFWSPSLVCTDPMGWVWTCWKRRNGSLAASYNWGNGWSEPEALTDTTGWPAGIVSDSRGRVYVLFTPDLSAYYTTCRQTRPGVQAGRSSPVSLPQEPGPTIVHGVLELSGGSDFPVAKGRGSETSPTFLLDISGRTVMELNPGPNDVSRLGAGVYFVRGPESGTGGQGEVRKVVIAR